MTDKDIEETIRKTFAEEFEIPEEKLVPGASIKDDLGLDSLDIVDMVVALEQAFGFKLPDRNAVVSIVTLDDLCAFIRKLRDDDVLPA